MGERSIPITLASGYSQATSLTHFPDPVPTSTSLRHDQESFYRSVWVALEIETRYLCLTIRESSRVIHRAVLFLHRR